jgi:hypothetical protein
MGDDMSWEPQIVRTVDLGYDQMLVIESQRGALIRVVHGGVWLTEEGLGRDVFAQGGDELPIEGDGRTVVQGMGFARVQFVDPARPAALLQKLFNRVGHSLCVTLGALRARGQLTARLGEPGACTSV